jgi:hypothetical protein
MDYGTQIKIKSNSSDFEPFVIQAFRQVLSRDPDPEGALDCILHLEAGYPANEILAKMLLSEEGRQISPSLPGRSLLLLRYRIAKFFRWLPPIRHRRQQRDRLLNCLRRASAAQTHAEQLAIQVAAAEAHAEQLAIRVAAAEEKSKSIDEKTEKLQQSAASLAEQLELLERQHLHTLLEKMTLLMSRQTALELQVVERRQVDIAETVLFAQKLREVATALDTAKAGS